MDPDAFAAWVEALEQRHLGTLTFAEVRRALQALSSLYVERRERLGSGAALESAGKRAAFALYYGPLHFLLVREVVRALGAALSPPDRLIDLGCGTGAAGAAWAVEAGAALVEGVDRSGWAVDEARWTLARFRLRGEARRGDLQRAALPGRGGAVLAAFTVNELGETERTALRERLLAAADAGARVLVIEPLARRALSWWPEWEKEFVARGGRADEWRFPARLPPLLEKLDRAAGLDHRELTGRSLWLPGARAGQAFDGSGARPARGEARSPTASSSTRPWPAPRRSPGRTPRRAGRR